LLHESVREVASDLQGVLEVDDVLRLVVDLLDDGLLNFNCGPVANFETRLLAFAKPFEIIQV
jgi:hypothetical protein